VSELSSDHTNPDRTDVDAVVEALASLWEEHDPDVPEWAAQELTFGQMRLLFLLSKHGPSPMSHIAEWLGVGLPTASGTVERVERHGLVERRHRVDDRRVVECQLTVAGRDLLEEIAGMHRDSLRQALGVLTEDELRELAGWVSIVVERTKSGPT
jgi:DNA-binding MarR family transcriptional regulator